ncbi:MAG TPA: alpha/beta fold hydrolase, partial [Polyangiaceae bacterium]|nr:alpha/beta fold hydrolase [Polyangiaceae bacterium]
MRSLGEIVQSLRRRGGRSEEARAVERALRARIARPAEQARSTRARIVFDAEDAGSWTVDIHDGEVLLAHGTRKGADATIRSDAATLADVLAGRRSGVQAFLEGRLFMRGNIALTLELDDLLHPPAGRYPLSPRARRVQAGEVRTFYLEAGPEDGPVVVLVHGLGATGASFLPTLFDLARDYRVIAVDLPGFGESDKPLRPLHAAYFAKWMVSFLDAIGVERAHFVGNSMGGRVSLEVALRSPERVDRLVLLAPSLAWRRYRALAGLVRLIRPELALLPLRAEHRLVVGVLRSLFARPERVPRAALDAAADEFVRVFHSPRGRIAFFHAAREIYLEDPHGVRGFWDRLRR